MVPQRSPRARTRPGGPGARRAAKEKPRLVVNAYASLGHHAEDHAQGYLRDYYRFVGEDLSGQIADGALTSSEAVADAVTGYEDANCDELILFPCNPDLTQVSLIAEAARL